MVNIRKNTAAQWLVENPTLRSGEQGLERDTKKIKVGDGVTPWVELPYQFNTAIADARYAPVAGSTAYATPAAVTAAVAPKLDASQKGAASGVAPLDSGSRVPEANLPANLAATTLSATFIPKWKATTAYLAGDKVVNPGGDIVSAVANFTSGASYNAANWALPTTYVRFVDLAGNPISARHVTIKVDTATWEIADIIAEA